MIAQPSGIITRPVTMPMNNSSKGTVIKFPRMLKTIHAQKIKAACRNKAKEVAEMPRAVRLPGAAKKIEDGVEEMLTYTDFPSEHLTRIRTNNVLEQLNREICRRTRVIGCFPDGNSAIVLVCARLRHVAGTQCGNKKHILEAMEESTAIAC